MLQNKHKPEVAIWAFILKVANLENLMEEKVTKDLRLPRLPPGRHNRSLSVGVGKKIRLPPVCLFEQQLFLPGLNSLKIKKMETQVGLHQTG